MDTITLITVIQVLSIAGFISWMVAIILKDLMIRYNTNKEKIR